MSKQDNPLLGTTVTCCECGKVEELHWNHETNQEMTDAQMCFTCNFWREKFEKISDPRWARVNGTSYYVNDPSNGPAQFKGFGGAGCKVRWFDGREAQSNDVWCQGDVPANWKERLPDNAEFLR